MAVILRAARPGDAAAMVAIWNPVIRETTITFTTLEKDEGELVADIRARRAEGRPWIVAEGVRGGLFGFAGWGPFRQGTGYARAAEHTLFVAPAAREKGIGRRLMAELCARARGAGIAWLVAGISGENEPAIAFHLKLGFSQVGRLPGIGFKFGRPLDLVLMQRATEPAILPPDIPAPGA